MPYRAFSGMCPLIVRFVIFYLTYGNNKLCLFDMLPKGPVVAFVPREVFSTTQKCLKRLYEVTEETFDLVCIDGNSDSETKAFLEDYSQEKGFKLLRSECYLSPNQARNMAYEWAKENLEADYIVFIDNDVLVTSGWLTAMVNCADETGAGIVGPAYYEHLPECSKLHMYGGECGIERDEYGKLTLFERHDCQHTEEAGLENPLVRKSTGLIEFHTVLVRMDLLAKTGGLDPALSCFAEHADLSMLAKQHGYEIWLEPDSKVTYVPPKRLERTDRDFFFLRWSEDWMQADQKHLIDKWDLEYFPNTKGRGLQWLRIHRGFGCQSVSRVRKIFGNKIGRFYEERIFKRLEPKWNRYKYASHKWK